MSFEVIPGLDVSEGRLVRITQTGAQPEEAFEGDALVAARAFVDAGAGRLHVVDVDLAHGGEPRNLDLLRALTGVGVPVQASGGVTTAGQIDALLSAGADRVVLGSAALASRESAEDLVNRFTETLVVAIEADGPAIRPRGRGSELPLWDTIVWLAGVNVRRYLFTEVRRVGGLEGPDLDGVWAFAMHAAVPVLAAGGIRGLDDLRAIAGLEGRIEGAVIGRALYEGLDLREALTIG
jgi:phosphoribosylformimino-5-aminoimidazole carboxamide ribotide isomerase